MGGNYSTPDRENISVGVSFFASARDALILYKSIRDGALFVIDAKGVFTRLRGVDVDLSDWSKLPRFASENTFKKEFISLDISTGPHRESCSACPRAVAPEGLLFSFHNHIRVLLEGQIIASTSTVCEAMV